VSKTANRAQKARTKARDRRLLALDVKRRDAQIESAVSDVAKRRGERDRARRAVEDAEDEIGKALRRVLAEAVTINHAAELCGLTVGEVRRLSRRPPADEATAPATGRFRAAVVGPMGRL